MEHLPKARLENIVIQELEKEILIYDLNTNKAFCLNETSSVVYQACDGRTTFEGLKLKTKFPVEIIYLALDELNRENLLDENQSYNSPLSGMSRREAIKKVGLASMIALPIIASVVAPTAIQAQSQSCFQISSICTNNSNCCSQFCLKPASGVPPGFGLCCIPGSTLTQLAPCSFDADCCTNMCEDFFGMMVCL